MISRDYLGAQRCYDAIYICMYVGNIYLHVYNSYLGTIQDLIYLDIYIVCYCIHKYYGAHLPIGIEFPQTYIDR